MVKFSWLFINAKNVFSLSLAVLSILNSTYLSILMSPSQWHFSPLLHSPSTGVWPFRTTPLSSHYLVVFGFHTLIRSLPCFSLFYLFVNFFSYIKNYFSRWWNVFQVRSTFSYVHSLHFVYSSRLFIIFPCIVEFLSLVEDASQYPFSPSSSVLELVIFLADSFPSTISARSRFVAKICQRETSRIGMWKIQKMSWKEGHMSIFFLFYLVAVQNIDKMVGTGVAMLG